MPQMNDWIHPQGNGLDLPPESHRPGRFQQLEDEYIWQHWGELFGYLKRGSVMTANRLERLKDFVLFLCNCPCCNENENCLSDCTFEEDCPEECGVMKHARDAMFGKE